MDIRRRLPTSMGAAVAVAAPLPIMEKPTTTITDAAERTARIFLPSHPVPPMMDTNKPGVISAGM